ncbi:hypothetical protein [Pantanalinema sp. GBBB05]|uniref:hypothetical protein n=1 Tax=Pantanalinema sp. GBBB05 TaxID=2604139 RepID=UPI001DEFC431|nr:hypothetical protein [Pantanalinema sp. GBBB05]
MSSSDQYKREIMNDLARGDTDSIDDFPAANNYENFDDFAQRSTKEERRHLFGRSFHPERVPSSQMEPELQKAVAQIQPNERDDVAKEFLKEFKQRGMSDRDLERQLGLSTHHASRMSADDVSKLAAYAYHNHPDLFRDVMADQPAILKFLSNPLIGAALGAIAAKWMGNRH